MPHGHFLSRAPTAGSRRSVHFDGFPIDVRAIVASNAPVRTVTQTTQHSLQRIPLPSLLCSHFLTSNTVSNNCVHTCVYKSQLLTTILQGHDCTLHPAVTPKEHSRCIPRQLFLVQTFISLNHIAGTGTRGQPKPVHVEEDHTQIGWHRGEGWGGWVSSKIAHQELCLSKQRARFWGDYPSA